MPDADGQPARSALATGATQDRAGHWEQVYREHGPRSVSWFQADPAISAELISAAVGTDRAVPVIDIGGGTSLLAPRLATSGFTDVTVLDISDRALDAARGQDPTGTVSFLQADVLNWQPPRQWQVWHDRAVFHFLTSPQDRAGYLATLRRALRPGGRIVLGTFAPGAPTHCSGLPVARYSAPDLGRELGDDFTVTVTRTEQHHTPAGAVQPFTWVSAQLRRDVA